LTICILNAAKGSSESSTVIKNSLRKYRPRIKRRRRLTIRPRQRRKVSRSGHRTKTATDC
jgi:hypothetical protein